LVDRESTQGAAVPFEVAKLQVFGNSNVGVYIYANDRFALVPPGLTPKDIDTISKVLQVDVYETTVMGTRLLGVLVTGNNNALLVPDTITQDELSS
jgi:Translation initiation factor 6 (eIF-6)